MDIWWRRYCFPWALRCWFDYSCFSMIVGTVHFSDAVDKTALIQSDTETQVDDREDIYEGSGCRQSLLPCGEWDSP